MLMGGVFFPMSPRLKALVFIFAHGIVWIGVCGMRAFSTSRYVASWVSDIMMIRTNSRNNLGYYLSIAMMTQRQSDGVHARVQCKNVLSLQRILINARGPQ